MPGKRDVDPEMSPLHFFGAEVRRAREAAVMTLADLGAMVPCDASTVSRIESGQLSPAERFARACDEAFPQMGGWFGRFYRASLRWDGPYPRWFEDWVDAEGRATVLRGWEPLLVPGLLQTPEYARARIWTRPGGSPVTAAVTAATASKSARSRRLAACWSATPTTVRGRCSGSPGVRGGGSLTW
jgi:transcriptional regulator with XRE-family HTH domain